MFVVPTGKSSSECGYCHSNTESSKSYGMWAYQMDCQHYQSLIDHGWRRSGCYLYKPNLSETCCPPYTIRLNCQNFNLSKSHKKTIKKIKKFIHPETTENGSNLSEWIENAEEKDGKMKVVLEPASFSNDTFELYKKYQIAIHKDNPEELTEKKFKRFLVDHPLNGCTQNDIDYGAFHQKYYFNDQLIACGVIDILPFCVSSVYFIYDPDFGDLSLGVYSALREIKLVHDLNQKSADLKYYYMGYYIHSCPKMTYKAQYRPSDLLCPEQFIWIPVSKCLPVLDKQKVCALSRMEDCDSSILKLKRPEDISFQDASKLKCFVNGAIVSISNAPVTKELIQDVREMLCYIPNSLFQYLILVL